MTSITRDFVHALRDDMNAALLEVAKKHNVAISIERATFGGNDVTFKVLVNSGTGLPGENARMAKVANALSLYKPMYPNIDFDAVYLNSRGERLKVVGYNTSARTMPFILQVEGTDKRYKMGGEFAHLRKVQA